MRKTLEERYWPKVDRRSPDECWPWLAALKGNGYGVIGRGGRGAGYSYAHRVAYELAVGPIPPSMTIDHLCRNRRCCNPSHLEIVTRGENTLRGNSRAAINARKSHCINGHPLADAFVWVAANGDVERHCRVCDRDRKRRKRAS